MKAFLKSTWFKCVIVLLLIAGIAGGLLAVLNDVLYVSPEERTSRALNKIYENRTLTTDDYEIERDVDRGDKEIPCEGYGYIQKIFIVDREDETDQKYDMLFKTTGTEGYKNGTITMWVQVCFDGTNKTIGKVLIDGYEKQTLMSKLNGSYLENFIIDISGNYQTYFTSNNKASDSEFNKNVITGATMSANAGCNAVNCVLKYLEGK